MKNVALEDIWYKTDDNSTVQSTVFPPTNANKAGEMAVAIAKVGSRNVGYIGDMNSEEGSNTVILAISRLL